MATGSVRSRDELFDEVRSIVEKASASRLGHELFTVVSLLDGEHALRRALTEPSVPAENKRTLVDSLLTGKVGSAALDVLHVAVGKRWSASIDLADALEEVAITALASSAEDAGKLDSLEAELFQFGQLLDSEPQLREALSDGSVSVEGKRSLLEDVLGRKLSRATKDLLGQLVMGRHRNLSRGLAEYQRVLAARHDRILATAWVASPLDQRQQDRMVKALSRLYSRQVHLNVVVDDDVIGGVRVKVGDDLIDSSVETRLAEARRELVG